MTPITATFGPVRVTTITPSASGACVRVRLKQECWLSYPPGSRPDRQLEEALDASDAAKVVVTCRRNTQVFTPEEAAKLSVGQQMPGHLQRIFQDKPRFKNQKSDYHGGYAYSVWQPEFAEDIDNRTTSP